MVICLLNIIYLYAKTRVYILALLYCMLFNDMHSQKFFAMFPGNCTCMYKGQNFDNQSCKIGLLCPLTQGRLIYPFLMCFRCVYIHMTFSSSINVTVRYR